MDGIRLQDIEIGTRLCAGDLGYIAYLHGLVYQQECGYGLPFEAYVLESIGDFARHYRAERDGVWICRHDDKIVGFLAAVHRGDCFQLRYFLLLEDYRGIGLGKKLMQLFIRYLDRSGLKKAYLWTTHEQLTAIHLYTQFGFSLREEKPSVAFGKPVREQYYELWLDE